MIEILLNEKTNTAIVSKSNGKAKITKEIDVRDLFDALSISKDRKEVKSNFKPVFSPLNNAKNGAELIQTIQTGRNSYFHILKVCKRKVPFIYYDSILGPVTMPTMLIAIKTVNNKANSIYAKCIKEGEAVEPDTKLYNYPFTNLLNDKTGLICLGQINISKKYIKDIDGLLETVNIFFNSPNTHGFSPNRNSKGLSLEQLLEEIKDDFDDDLLVENNKYNYNSWIEELSRITRGDV